MQLKLHANATTTPRTRAYIQSSTASVTDLAEELGVSETTVRRWRRRGDVQDRSHRPHRLQTGFSPLEERLICELRAALGLSVDDITEVMNRCVREGFARSSVHRCLARNGASGRAPAPKPARRAFETDRPLGFIHCDVKYLPVIRKRRFYAFVAIDRATRYVYLEVHRDRSAKTACAFLKRFLEDFPHEVHTILTDNGTEWTDRYANDRKGKRRNAPSGEHAFDQLCAQRGVKHKLTRPFRPQTNGMVERFNRRLAEHLRAMKKHRAGRSQRFFGPHDLTAFVMTFVHDYNRTRLRCLDYKSPIEMSNNLPGHNTLGRYPNRRKDGRPSAPND